MMRRFHPRVNCVYVEMNVVQLIVNVRSFYAAVQLCQFRQILNVFHGFSLVVSSHVPDGSAQCVHLLHHRIPHVLQIPCVILVQEESDVAVLNLVIIRLHNVGSPCIHQNHRVRFFNDKKGGFG